MYEVNISLVLLAMFGISCFLLEFWCIYWDSFIQAVWRIYLLTNRVGFDCQINPLSDIESQLIENKESILDEDVFNEMVSTRALTSDAIRGYAIVMKNLRKEFYVDQSGVPMVAIDNLNLALRYGEVFGLLGPNGMCIIIISLQ